MSINVNIGAAMEEARREAAERLLRAAVYFQDQQRQRVGVSSPGERRRRTRDTVAGKKGSTYTVYPSPSKQGEYPRKQTGKGQADIVYGPETAAEIIAEGLKVRIGGVVNNDNPKVGNHLLFLELERQRLGFAKTAADIEPQIKGILSA